MSQLVNIVPVPTFTDERGELVALQQNAPLAFVPKRTFIIRNVPEGAVRAKHAVSCEEFLVLLAGACRITVKERKTQKTIDMTDRNTGIFVKAGLWISLSHFTEDAILMVLCSEEFENVSYFSEPKI